MLKITKYHKKLKLTAAAAGFLTMGLMIFLSGEMVSKKGIKSDEKYEISISGIALSADSKDEAELVLKKARYDLIKSEKRAVYINPNDIEIKKESSNSKESTENKEITESKEVIKSKESKESKNKAESDELTLVKNIISENEMTITQKESAVLLNVDGNINILKSADEAKEVLNEVKQKYDSDQKFAVELNKNSSGHFDSYDVSVTSDEILDTDKLQNISFAENVEVISTYSYSDDISTKEEVLSNLTEEKDTESRYEVVDGDCISTIANDHGMYVKDFLELNADSYLKEDSTIYVGDVYKILTPKPELSVERVERSTKKEYYRAQPTYVEDDSLYQGEEKTISKGKKGYRKITIDTTIVDGVETKTEIVDEEVKKEAVPAVIAKGTAIKPSYIRPISGGRTTSYFGYRAIFGDFHLGQDWAVPTGTSVYASCGGTVASAGWNGSYGLSVLITHPNGIQTRYGHLSELSVSAGQTVEQGQRIGFSGSTGNSTGPHLHFEVIENGQVVDPLGYVSEY